MYETLMEILFCISLISTVVVFVSSTLGVYYICKAYNAGKVIKEETFKLGKDPNDEKVERYSGFVENINIPNRKVYCKTLRAGYKLVNGDGNVNEKSKEKLKKIMLSKGILVV